MARIEDISREALGEEGRAIYDEIAAGPRGVVQGPLRVWLNSPPLAARAQALGAFCRYDTVLPPRLSELAILVVGAHWRAGFEWAVHEPIARREGIAAAATEAIRTGGTPDLTGDEAAVYRYAHELVTDRRVRQESHDRAVATLGERGVVDLVGILGYYTLISMTIVGFEVDLPEGAPEPFADRG